MNFQADCLDLKTFTTSPYLGKGRISCSAKRCQWLKRLPSVPDQLRREFGWLSGVWKCQTRPAFYLKSLFFSTTSGHEIMSWRPRCYLQARRGKHQAAVHSKSDELDADADRSLSHRLWCRWCKKNLACQIAFWGGSEIAFLAIVQSLCTNESGL